MSDSEGSGSDRDDFRRVKGPADVQRLRVERLMKNPEKAAHIPEPPKTKAPPPPAEYVRFYMGSSAGAGSGEFHIYRNLRRKEQNRMKFIDDEAKKDALQDDFTASMSEKRKIEEEKIAKNRAKRQKKKQRSKNKPGNKLLKNGEAKEEETSSSEDDANPSEANIPESRPNALPSQTSESNPALDVPSSKKIAE